MRIIGGYLKGKNLYFEKNNKIRPTKNIVREAIFDILGDEVKNRKILDVFAGTGALGIESLSRGADFVVLVENSIESLSLLKKNIHSLGIENKAKIILSSAERAIKNFSKNGEIFDIIFADPPYYYEGKKIEKIFKFSQGCVKYRSILIIETFYKAKMPEISNNWQMVKEKKYSSTKISIYEYERDNCRISGQF
ncbi:MAG: 16S rRNA (guanine(966)-N(2))-methyltransferase RsmD [Candidatus Omnitrophica bacterium]|nr:16S rRNA (guanine(966)-N(2))-methyltransferase RsmD [Candidatus Omnitrophota bacterium]